jgi:hypothetical protein
VGKDLRRPEANMTDQARSKSPTWRRNLRFSVRGLVLLVLMFGVWLGWTAYRVRIQRDAIKAIRQAGGRIEYNWEWANGAKIPNGKPRWPKWVVDLVDINYLGHVTKVALWSDTASDENLVHISQLDRHEERVFEDSSG